MQFCGLDFFSIWNSILLSLLINLIAYYKFINGVSAVDMEEQNRIIETDSLEEMKRGQTEAVKKMILMMASSRNTFLKEQAWSEIASEIKIY